MSKDRSDQLGIGKIMTTTAEVQARHDAYEKELARMRIAYAHKNHRPIALLCNQTHKDRAFLLEQLEQVNLRLKTCSGNCTEHELNEAKALEQLEQVAPLIILDEFKTAGLNASFHYADDTASGEYRLGKALELRARKLYDKNPKLQDEMKHIAKRFIWSL